MKFKGDKVKPKHPRTVLREDLLAVQKLLAEHTPRGGGYPRHLDPHYRNLAAAERIMRTGR